MKNNKILYGIIGIVALAMVDLIVFITVKEFTVARWINIAFLNLSILIFWAAGIMNRDANKRFMDYFRFPVVSVYTVIAFIISALFVMFGVKNITITIVVQAIMLGVFIIVMCTNTMANNASADTMETDKNNYNKIKDMSDRLYLIMQNVNEKEVYKKIEKAYDSIKNAKLTLRQDSTQIDNDIIQAIGIVESSIQNNNFSAIDEQLNKIDSLIIKRNMM